MLNILQTIIPVLYQKFFVHYDYIYMFYVSQAAYVIAESLNLLAATRYNLYLGIPDPLMFILGGSIA